MKKILSLVLCLTFVLSFTSCGKHDSSEVSDDSAVQVNSTVNVDVAKYAEKGEILGCEFSVGTLPQTIKDVYHYDDAGFWGTGSDGDSSDIRYNIDAVELVITGEDVIKMSTGDARYYYRADREESGIAYIAYFGNAFDFDNSTDTDFIRKSVKKAPVSDGMAESDELFFFFGEPEDIYRLGYEFGDNILSFYFVDGKLSATTIYSKTAWN